MEISRNKIQEYSLQSLTSFLICRDSNLPIDVENTLSLVTNCPYEEVPLYLKEIVICALKNLSSIESYVSQYLRNWKFSRLNYCIQSILILSVVNYTYLKETNKNITINIAIELAKKYGDKDDYKFINAILDNCLKEDEH